MADTHSLINRMDAEFALATQKTKTFQTQQLGKYHDRKKRRETVEQLLRKLHEDWRPRREALVERFQERANLTPLTTPFGWEETLKIQSDLARVRVKFSASTDIDAHQLVLDYDLEVIPIFLRYEPHARLELAADSLDRKAAGKWMDDRIIDFVQVYLSLQENDQYRREHLVEDPIAQMWFPKFAAAATFESNGQTYYFLAEETRREFAGQHHESAPSERSPAGRETDYFPAESALVL